MGFGPINNCNDLTYLENQDGTVSVFMSLGSVLIPSVITETCCLAKGYKFDNNNQKCYWKDSLFCNIEDTYKITLNPVGDDAALFFLNDDEKCKLNIEFDYLFKFDCQKMLNLYSNPDTIENTFLSSTIKNQIDNLNLQITQQEILCSFLENQISAVTYQINTTPYSITCQGSSSQESSGVNTDNAPLGNFNNSGFGNIGPINTSLTGLTPINSSSPISPLDVDTQLIYCLTDAGLDTWQSIIGPINYVKFLFGDNETYTCQDVDNIVNQNLTSPEVLLNECEIPIDTKSSLISQLNELKAQQTECNEKLTSLQNEVLILEESGGLITTLCNEPINMLETLDVTMLVEYLDDNNNLISLYEGIDLFPAIGNGELYNYLTANNESGFYICDSQNCSALIFDKDLNIIPPAQNSCQSVVSSILEDLFVESGLVNNQTNIDTFNSSIPKDAFSSKWKHYSLLIEDENIINEIKNKKIKISLNINHTCGDVCILLDNIKINKECEKLTKTEIFVTTCPGFDLERIVDNKKSWVDSIENRDFEILNSKDFNPIRQTNYDSNDERLIINSKEIDLDINIASAIENSVWCYTIDNECILSGETLCNPCDNEDYYSGFGNSLSVCCGDNTVKINELLSSTITESTSFEEFKYFLKTELIDVKNRQTLSSYPTLKLLYDRYLNSQYYCGTLSSAFSYLTMEEFSNLIGDYWVDLVEQVIPSTTIWGSVKIYSNTIFDQQKHQYKSYTSFFCDNPLFGEKVLSPINSISGQCTNVDVDILNISTGATWSTLPSKTNICDTLCISQMNFGSEFIGNVTILGDSTSCDNNGGLNSCDMNLNVEIDGYTVTAIVTNFTGILNYEWSNGGVNPVETFSVFGNYTLTVTDENCCSKTIEFYIPKTLKACWYSLPDSIEWIENGFDSYGITGYTYSIDSFILNGVELITGSTPTYTLTELNYATVPTNTGITYTNFVTFLNDTFNALNLTDYKAQISLNNINNELEKYNGFYLIRPLGDEFDIYVSETNNMDIIYSENSVTDSFSQGQPTKYRKVICDNINLVDNTVIE